MTTPEQTRSRIGRWSTRLLVALVGLALGALTAEVVLRVVGFSYMQFERPDQARGVSLGPGTSGWQTVEGRVFVTINSHGYRDRERQKTKSTGTYRIAVLGDSFVEARQIPLEDTCWSLLEGLLSGTSSFGGKRVEVLPFGVSGYGTAQELMTLRSDVLEFDPDLVVLAFFPGNDISDNSKALSPPSRTIPFFSVRGDELVLDASFRESPAFKDRNTWIARTYYAIQEYSRLLQLLYKTRVDLHKPTQAQLQESSFTETGLANPVYQEPTDPDWQEAWLVTERLVSEMADELRQRGIGFRVVTVSTPIQANPDVALRQGLAEQLHVDDLFYPDRRIKALGDKAGFSVLNLGQQFQQYADEHQVFLHGFKNTGLGLGHWNQEGHRLAATLIARWLTGQGTSGSHR